MVGSTPDKKAKKKKSPPVRVRDVVPEVDHRSRKAKIEFTVPLRILDMTAQVTSVRPVFQHVILYVDHHVRRGRTDDKEKIWRVSGGPEFVHRSLQSSRRCPPD